jgi:hypothetical protein
MTLILGGLDSRFPDVAASGNNVWCGKISSYFEIAYMHSTRGGARGSFSSITDLSNNQDDSLRPAIAAIDNLAGPS